MNGDQPGGALHTGPGAERDLPVLRDIERAAGEPFRGLGMDAVADDPRGSTDGRACACAATSRDRR